MEYTTLGQTDVSVSRVGLGLWNVSGDVNWDRVEEDDAVETIQAAVDAGITFLDTAEAYGDGYSESVLGAALETLNRDDVVVATKAHQSNLTYDDLKAACEASLDRLGVDTIDVYYLHYPNPDVPVTETARALRELQEEGKIRVPAVSNHGVRDLNDVLDEVRVEANQLPYNLLWRAIEYEVKEACRTNDVDVVCYSALAQGLLAGKFDSPDDVPPGRARTRHFSGEREHARHGEEGAETETFEAIAEFEALCEEFDVGMVEAAIAWPLQREGVGSVLVGATSPEQARANAEAASLSLPEEFVERAATITDELKETLGPNPDPWQSESRYR
ncbi:aldo/keto reductase [Halarchaeum sp. P4]|uniref:aldo/keto reductase n=1 Tax=Halarchaeum sp. P4 TaxID=3421639 RepID=UPI003EBF5763